MSFDGLAPIYRGMEALLAGRKLQRCRTAFLGEIPPPRNILLPGEGHGRCLVECRRRFPSARILCVDESPGMIGQAKKHLERSGFDVGSVEFVCRDIRRWVPPTGLFDLIVTQFFLDCFRKDELEALVPAVAASGTPDAQWLLADFQLPETGWRKWRSRAILWAMYRFFRVTTRLSASGLASPDPFLRRAGFGLHHRRESEWGLLKSEWWRRSGGGAKCA